MHKGSKPIKVFRAGQIEAAVWRSEGSKEGGSSEFSVRIQKRYLDKKTEEWKTTDYLFENDLPRLEVVARKAFEFIVLTERGDDAADSAA